MADWSAVSALSPWMDSSSPIGLLLQTDRSVLVLKPWNSLFAWFVEFHLASLNFLQVPNMFDMLI